MGAATFFSGCLDRRNDTPTDNPNWEQQADRAIRANRTTELDIKVTNRFGIPVPGAAVTVEMTAHDFRFGTAVNAPHLVHEAERGDPYRAHLSKLFNTAVLAVRHKWKPWETPADRELADHATEWLLDNGFDVRGHTVLWQDLDSGAVPEDVVTKLESDDPDRSDYLAERTTNHIRDIVGHYAGHLTDWDLLNEHVDNHSITEAIAPNEPPQQSPPLIEWFETAAAVAPDTDLYCNDYNLIVGDEEDHREQFETLIAYLQNADAPIDGIGMQGHFGSLGAAIDPNELRSLLDRYAALGVDLQVTEYDTFGQGWTEQDEADHLAVVLKTLFGHPAVVGFLMWGFWDGIHWQNNAPLFREDWSTKPAYDVYVDLVFDEWWTHETGRTGLNGNYSTRAFLGNYEITATWDGYSTTVTTSLTEPTADTIVVRI